MDPVEGLVEAAELAVDRCEPECKPAAIADVHEARSLIRYISEENLSTKVQSERCLYTFLVILRAGVDASIPAPKSLRDFSRFVFHDSSIDDLFPGVDEDEDVWVHLEALWREFNQQKVCRRSSELCQSVADCCPRLPHPRPEPLLFESRNSVKRYESLEYRRPCGWGCFRGECVEQASASRPVYCGNRPDTSGRPTSKNPKCSCDMGTSSDECWNIFDLVERMVHQEYFFSLPVHNLGWNLRKSMQTVPDSIETAYLKARVRVKQHVYPEWEDPPMLLRFRVREVRRLLRGLRSSSFLHQLLLSSPPKATVPLFYSLADAPIRARLWLLRANLPVFLGHSLTYSTICTMKEAKDACDLLAQERGPSILELCLRNNTWADFWGHRAAFGLRGVRVASMRPEDYDVPETVLQDNEKLWKVLVQLPCPMLLSAQGVQDVQQGCPINRLVASYLPHLEYETRHKLTWLFSHVEGKKPEYTVPHIRSVVVEAFERLAKLSETTPFAAPLSIPSAFRDEQISTIREGSMIRPNSFICATAVAADDQRVQNRFLIPGSTSNQNQCIPMRVVTGENLFVFPSSTPNHNQAPMRVVPGQNLYVIPNFISPNQNQN